MWETAKQRGYNQIQQFNIYKQNSMPVWTQRFMTLNSYSDPKFPPPRDQLQVVQVLSKLTYFYIFFMTENGLTWCEFMDTELKKSFHFAVRLE
jgi:hypothetical protein